MTTHTNQTSSNVNSNLVQFKAEINVEDASAVSDSGVVCMLVISRQIDEFKEERWPWCAVRVD